MDKQLTTPLDEVRYKATLLSTPVLGTLCFGGAWVIQALPIQPWETYFFIGCGLGFYLAGLLAWLKPTASTLTTGLIMVLLVAVMEVRILSVFEGPIFADESKSIFLVLFAHIPLFYLYCFMVFQSRVALRWSIAASILYNGTTLIYLIPALLEDSQREGARHLLLWVTISTPGFIWILSFMQRFERALIQLHSQHDAVAARQELYKHQATHDYLTGLHNRLSFDHYFNQQWQDCVKNGRGLGLLMIDVDHFKTVNDTHGHAAGDMALQQLAITLSSNVRERDTVARYGGEEFTVLLHDTDPIMAKALAERIRDAVACHIFRVNSQAQQLTVSIGISAFSPNEKLQPKLMVDMADQALYIAKNNGRNRVHYFDPPEEQAANLDELSRLESA